jgi:co-chaperonin GroES (HSP10)
MIMKIRPLQGQALVLLLPRDEKIGEIFIAETANSSGSKFVKRSPRKAIVQAIGPWRTTRNGKAILPDFRKGDTVVLNDYIGNRLTHDVKDHLRLVKVDDVLGVLTNAD